MAGVRRPLAEPELPPAARRRVEPVYPTCELLPEEPQVPCGLGFLLDTGEELSAAEMPTQWRLVQFRLPDGRVICYDLLDLVNWMLAPASAQGMRLPLPFGECSIGNIATRNLILWRVYTEMRVPVETRVRALRLAFPSTHTVLDAIDAGNANAVTAQMPVLLQIVTTPEQRHGRYGRAFSEALSFNLVGAALLHQPYDPALLAAVIPILPHASASSRFSVLNYYVAVWPLPVPAAILRAIALEDRPAAARLLLGFLAVVRPEAALLQQLFQPNELAPWFAMSLRPRDVDSAIVSIQAIVTLVPSMEYQAVLQVLAPLRR